MVVLSTLEFPQVTLIFLLPGKSPVSLNEIGSRIRLRGFLLGKLCSYCFNRVFDCSSPNVFTIALRIGVCRKFMYCGTSAVMIARGVSQCAYSLMLICLSPVRGWPKTSKKHFRSSTSADVLSCLAILVKTAANSPGGSHSSSLMDCVCIGEEVNSSASAFAVVSSTGLRCLIASHTCVWYGLLEISAGIVTFFFPTV